MGTPIARTITAVAVAAGASGITSNAQALDLDIYAGANYLFIESSVDTNAATPPSAPDRPRPTTVQRKVRSEADGAALMAHFGVWLNESFAVELRGGFPVDSAEFGDAAANSEGTAELEEYVGVYLVPRAKPFSWVDAVFPIGMSRVKVAMPVDTDGNVNNGADAIVSTDTATISYGMDIRWRVGSLVADPDSLLGSISINTGFMVYGNDDDLETRGFNGGLQVGFQF